MESAKERRAARRFSMMLPLKVRFSEEDDVLERQGETRDVSFRGLYFLIEARVEAGTPIEFVLTFLNKSRSPATCTFAVMRECCAWSRKTGAAEWQRASTATNFFPPPPDASAKQSRIVFYPELTGRAHVPLRSESGAG